MLISVDTNEFLINLNQHWVDFRICAWVRLRINLDQHWLTSNWAMECDPLLLSFLPFFNDVYLNIPSHISSRGPVCVCISVCLSVLPRLNYLTYGPKNWWSSVPWLWHHTMTPQCHMTSWCVWRPLMRESEGMMQERCQHSGVFIVILITIPYTIDGDGDPA